MRDVDVNFRTQLFTRRDSSIATLADLKGKRVALGSRGSAQAGLLPYYFLKQHGLDPQRDLAACTFAEEREPSPLSEERAVVELVLTGAYDAGCRESTDPRRADRARPADAGHPPRLLVEPRVQPLFALPAHRELDAGIAQKITDAFLSLHYTEPAGQRGAGRRGLPGVCARHHDRLGRR